ncbi:uncharacterized protein KRP23_14904 [Phytophthora ramorum]|uniref:uncharacterized protein n=1 Tax=Phytophthora ramorum TaxID=164328 RepID=UPI0030A38096|nr:hypothetical protein KRP23_14904 [Phytophthora ramorum]
MRRFQEQPYQKRLTRGKVFKTITLHLPKLLPPPEKLLPQPPPVVPWPGDTVPVVAWRSLLPVVDVLDHCPCDVPVDELVVDAVDQPPVVVEPVEGVDAHWFEADAVLPVVAVAPEPVELVVVVVDVDGAVVVVVELVDVESVVGAVVVVVVEVEVVDDEAELAVAVAVVVLGVEVVVLGVEVVEVVELVLLEVVVLVPELAPDTAYEDVAPVDVVVSRGAQLTYTCQVDECSANQ